VASPSGVVLVECSSGTNTEPTPPNNASASTGSSSSSGGGSSSGSGSGRTEPRRPGRGANATPGSCLLRRFEKPLEYQLEGRLGGTPPLHLRCVNACSPRAVLRVGTLA